MKVDKILVWSVRPAPESNMKGDIELTLIKPFADSVVGLLPGIEVKEVSTGKFMLFVPIGPEAYSEHEAIGIRVQLEKLGLVVAGEDYQFGKERFSNVGVKIAFYIGEDGTPQLYWKRPSTYTPKYPKAAGAK